jgi:hypothetical protein
MSEADRPEDKLEGLYVTDAEIARRMGFGLKCGYRIIRQLERGVPGCRPYPQPDALFAGRRFWPEVLKWHMDYHRVSASAPGAAASKPMWQENFDGPSSRKAGGHRGSRPEMAST